MLTFLKNHLGMGKMHYQKKHIVHSFEIGKLSEVRCLLNYFAQIHLVGGKRTDFANFRSLFEEAEDCMKEHGKFWRKCFKPLEKVLFT